MSKVNGEVCKTIVVGNLLSVDCMVFGKPQSCYKMEQECGVDLESIPDNAEANKYLEAAKKTGNPIVLSKQDAQLNALKQELFDDVNLRLLAMEQPGCLPIVTRLQGSFLNDFSQCFGKLPLSTQTAIQNRANRFLEEARILVARIRGPQKGTPK